MAANYWDFLMGRGPLKKAASTGDPAPPVKSTPAQSAEEQAKQAEEMARRKREQEQQQKAKTQPRMKFGGNGAKGMRYGGGQ